jgi:mRNA interferase RelE/StbE
VSFYNVQIMPQGQKDLDDFSGKLLLKFQDIILGLYDEPRPEKAKKLKGSVSSWRIRSGDYRILYEIDDSRKLVKVYRIAHRKEAYR